MIGTFMAWLTDVGAGGGTSYTAPGKVQIFGEGHKNLKKISHFVLTLLKIGK